MHASNPRTQEPEVGRVYDELSLYSELQDSQGYIVRGLEGGREGGGRVVVVESDRKLHLCHAHGSLIQYHRGRRQGGSWPESVSILLLRVCRVSVYTAFVHLERVSSAILTAFQEDMVSATSL